jgi:hypothetical protein
MQRNNTYGCTENPDCDGKQYVIPEGTVAGGSRREYGVNTSSQQIVSNDTTWGQHRKHQMPMPSEERGVVRGIFHCGIDQHFHFERSRAVRLLHLCSPAHRGLQDIGGICCDETTHASDQTLCVERKCLPIESQHHRHNVHSNANSSEETAREKEMTVA